MPRKPRVIIPFIPYHIVQRGCRREKVFFEESDFRTYIRFLKISANKYNVEIWCYCLMDNHIHMIAYPKDSIGLSKMISHAHHRYSCFINRKMGWTGHLWQYRFSSKPLEENEILITARYIERNPVPAKIVRVPCDYLWSSANCHAKELKDELVTKPHLHKQVENWEEFINQPTAKEIMKELELEEKKLLFGKLRPLVTVT